MASECCGPGRGFGPQRTVAGASAVDLEVRGCGFSGLWLESRGCGLGCGCGGPRVCAQPSGATATDATLQRHGDGRSRGRGRGRGGGLRDAEAGRDSEGWTEATVETAERRRRRSGGSERDRTGKTWTGGQAHRRRGSEEATCGEQGTERDWGGAQRRRHVEGQTETHVGRDAWRSGEDLGSGHGAGACLRRRGRQGGVPHRVSTKQSEATA